MATPIIPMRLPDSARAALDWLAEAEQNQSAKPGNRTTACANALIRWERLLRIAVADNAVSFSPGEWCLLADVLNGYMWPDPSADIDVGHECAGFIVAEVADAHRLNRLGDKWLVAKDAATVNRKRVDAAIDNLIGRIDALDTLHVAALAFVVKRFWLHPDWSTETEWWLPDVPDAAVSA